MQVMTSVPYGPLRSERIKKKTATDKNNLLYSIFLYSKCLLIGLNQNFLTFSHMIIKLLSVQTATVDLQVVTKKLRPCSLMFMIHKQHQYISRGS